MTMDSSCPAISCGALIGEIVRCIREVQKLDDNVLINYETIALNGDKIEFETHRNGFGGDDGYFPDMSQFQNNMWCLVHQLGVFNATMSNYMSYRQMLRLQREPKKMFDKNDINDVLDECKNVTRDNVTVITTMVEDIRIIDARGY